MESGSRDLDEDPGHEVHGVDPLGFGRLRPVVCTLMPAVSMMGVAAGTVTSERGPTATMRSPAIRTTPSWRGGPS
jgi:hypothetical protein